MGRALAFVVVVAFASPARADGAATDVQKLLDRTDAIAAEVAKLRGLEIKQPIKRGVKTRAEIRASLLANIDRETTKEEIAVEERTLKRLGLLAGDADYKKLYVDLATDQIAGFYDPWEKELYIADGLDLGASGFDDGPPVMAHEIDHALQDQHFDLRPFMDGAGDNGDAALARQALVEGDGMAVMIEYMFSALGADPPWGDPKVTRQLEAAFEMTANGTDSLSKAPLFMQVGMMFPYTGGLRFVMRYRTHHAWKRIDKMYSKPPLSTEHILHPKKYSLYERPDEVTVAPIEAFADYKQVHLDVTGELGFATLLRQHGVDREVAAEAADGWGGDRLAVYAPVPDDGKVDSLVIVSYLVWDDETEAIDAFDAAVSAIEQLAGGKQIANEAARAAFRDVTGDELRVERHGDAVVIVIGAPKSTSDAIAAQVVAKWKVKRR